MLLDFLSTLILSLLSWAGIRLQAGERHCIVTSTGLHNSDAAPAILDAVNKCGKGGIITLPSPIYPIRQPIVFHLDHSVLNIHGYLEFSSDIEYWVENSYRFPFQNQSIAMHITGNDFVVDGHGTGGIDGNGQAWYSWAKGAGNVYGRPMSVSITNATRAVVKNFNIIQPQFWASLVWNSTDILLSNFYINATNTDPAARNENWVQNTDGSDTYQSRNITFENWVYQGGDDCIALKPNSSQITIRNIACYSNYGIAFGSIGQYPDKYDIIEDVLIENVFAESSPEVQLLAGTYFKSWIGVEVGSHPNGGGGGDGYCRNVTVKNLHVVDGELPVYLTSNLTYSELDKSYANTSTFKWDDIHFYNVSGTSKTEKVFEFECSAKAPCSGWTFEGITIKPGKKSSRKAFVCHNFDTKNSGLENCRA